MTRIVPDSYDDDTVFLFASRLIHHRDPARWDIVVDPEHCLAGAVGPPVSAIQSETPAIDDPGDRVVYEGRILLSAGVVFVLNGNHVLIERGPDAPTAPGQWTSPAGRCEHDPGTTALTEFYEELALTAGEHPVFVTWGERSDAYVETYRETVQQLGHDIPPTEWREFDAGVPDSFARHLSTVTTTYGDQEFSDEMLTYYVPETNTLELRFVLRVDVPGDVLETISLHDVEYDRTVALFDRETLKQIPPSDIVATDRYIVNELLPDIDTDS